MSSTKPTLTSEEATLACPPCPPCWLVGMREAVGGSTTIAAKLKALAVPVMATLALETTSGEVSLKEAPIAAPPCCVVTPLLQV